MVLNVHRKHKAYKGRGERGEKVWRWGKREMGGMRMYLWWSTLYLHACQVRVIVVDSGLCCTSVVYFER